MTHSDVHRAGPETTTGPAAHPAEHEPSVIRSEERLRVTTETVPVRRVRMRKYLVTEERTVTVPVTREEIAFDHEDLPPHEQVPDGTGPLSDTVHEVVRYEERVVVTTQLVAVERVRMIRRVVTADQTVAGQVRREVVDVDQAVEQAADREPAPPHADRGFPQP